MPSLSITPAPFAPSRISIPPSPHSPLSPLTPSYLNRIALGPKSSTAYFGTATLAPPKPLPWVWQCHLCNRTYPLGVTRRCLDDGHLFCSGDTCTTTVRGGKKRKAGSARKRGRACASEFDYSGWKTYGEWRRRELETRALAAGERVRKSAKKDCEHTCDYPSECRWGKATSVSVPSTPAPAPTSFEEMLGVTPEDRKRSSSASARLESVAEEEPEPTYSFWNALLDGAKQPKEDDPTNSNDEDTVEVDVSLEDDEGKPLHYSRIYYGTGKKVDAETSMLNSITVEDIRPRSNRSSSPSISPKRRRSSAALGNGMLAKARYLVKAIEVL